MGKGKKILIAEDHKILREGLISLLGSEADMEVAGEAEDGLQAIRKAEELKPDLILLDLSMPRMNGISVIKQVKAHSPQIRILVLTVHESEDLILEAFRLGVDGYCLKDASRSELRSAIRRVLSGKAYLSPSVSEKVLEGYLECRKSLKMNSSWGRITVREKDVLKLVAEGYKNSETARLLCISVKTVEKHRANIMRKLDLHTASALTAVALEKGLVTRTALEI